ncbi:PAS domain S-box protein, partial [Streptomyces termitum]
DRAERHAAEREAQAEKYAALAARHAQLTAVLADSLRGPLEELRSELGSLAADDGVQLWPEANQVLHHLVAGYARMTALVDNVLGYQRLDAGEEKLDKVVARLDGIVTGGIDAAVELIGPGRAQFAVHAPPIEAEIDAERLTTALAHLVADVAGVDATGKTRASAQGSAAPADSTIVVAAAQRGEVVRIEVRGPYAGGDPVHGPIVRGIVAAHGGVVQTHEVPGTSGGAYVLEVPIGAGRGTVPSTDLETVPERGAERADAPGAAAEPKPAAGAPGAAVAALPAQASGGEGSGGAPGPGRRRARRGSTDAFLEGPVVPEEGPGAVAVSTGGGRRRARVAEEAAGPAELIPAQQTTGVEPTGRRRGRPAEGAVVTAAEGAQERAALGAAVPPQGVAVEPTGAPAPGQTPNQTSNQAPGQVSNQPQAPVPAPAKPRVQAPAPAPALPAAQTGAPVAPAGTPTARTGTPAAPPGVPAAQAGTPAARTGTPMAPAGMPTAQTGTPVPPAGMPTAQTGTPVPPAGMSVPSGGPVPNSASVPSGAPASVLPAVVETDGERPPTGRRRRALAAAQERAAAAEAGPRTPFALPPAGPVEGEGGAGPGGEGSAEGVASTGAEPVPENDGVRAGGHQAVRDVAAGHTPPQAHPLPAAGANGTGSVPLPPELPMPKDATQGRAFSVRTLGQGVPFAPPAPAPSSGSGRRRRLATPPEADPPAAAPAPASVPLPAPVPVPAPSEGRGRAYAIGAPAEGSAEGPEPLDGPGGAVEVVNRPAPLPVDDELPPEPLDNPRRLLVWPAPDVATQQALSDRGYRPVIVHSREEVDAQIAAFPAALFVDPLTGPITRTALQSLRTAAVAAEVPVLLAAGLGQAGRDEAYGADPAVLLKALAPRDSEQHPSRVLVIEENEHIADALSAALERRGMRVARAATDTEAVALAGETRPNLVVMDLMQVRRRRAGIIDWLRANGQLNRTPLVVYTSLGLDADRLPELSSGETVLFLAERANSDEVQARIVDLLAKIGTN